MKRTLLTSTLVIAAAIGLYGSWANWSNTYDRGVAQGCNGDKQQAYEKGEAAGRDAGHRMAQTEAESAAQSKLNSFEADMRAQYGAQVQAEIQRSYQAGMAAEAKLIIEHDIRLISNKVAK